MPGEAVDLEGDLFVGGAEGVVDEPPAAVDVFGRVVVGEFLDLLEAEDLGEEVDKNVLRARWRRLGDRWRWICGGKWLVDRAACLVRYWAEGQSNGWRRRWEVVETVGRMAE